MRHFDELHPMVLGIYFMAVIIPVMFAGDFYIALAALATGLMLRWFMLRKVPLANLGISIIIVAAMILCNSIFSHRGTTELFFVNGRAVTLESVKYGAVTGFMLASVIVWFENFSGMMKSDKIMMLFGKMPKTALVISMILRLVPEYVNRFAKVKEAQEANHGEKGAKRSGMLKISSAVFTWALENGMQTADSIIRRNGKNCSIVPRKALKSRDISVLSIVVGLQACCFAPEALHAVSVAFLGMMPLMWEGKECIKWRVYSSRK